MRRGVADARTRGAPRLQRTAVCAYDTATLLGASSPRPPRVMPPRRRACGAGDVPALSRWASLADLPSSLLLQRAVGTLPVHERLRCRAVCRAWRAALSEPQLWQCVELVVRNTEECRRELRAASSLAGGALRTAHCACRSVRLFTYRRVGSLSVRATKSRRS